MKTILVIAFATFGPGNPPGAADAWMHRYDLKTEQACMEAAKRWPRPGAPGQIGNLPGYRGIEGAWCEDPNAPWPAYDAPLMATPITPNQ